jgi:hypothetical protein
MGWTIRAAAPSPGTTEARLAGATDIGICPGPALLDAAGCTVRVPDAHTARALPGGHIRIGGAP